VGLVWDCNCYVGFCCWLLIFILLRLTAFIPEQRYKLNLILLALVLLRLSINVGMAPQKYPKSNQIKYSQAMQTNFKLEIILEYGLLNQFGNKAIIKGSQGNYLTKQKLNQQTLRPANQISQFIYAQLASFAIHESTKEISPPRLGQRSFIRQLIPIDNHRFCTRAHRSRYYRPLYELN
jgi:hypothetical protein